MNHTICEKTTSCYTRINSYGVCVYITVLYFIGYWYCYTWVRAYSRLGTWTSTPWQRWLCYVSILHNNSRNSVLYSFLTSKGSSRLSKKCFSHLNIAVLYFLYSFLISCFFLTMLMRIFFSIKWSLVSPSYKSQYVKHSTDFVNTYEIPYDYGSIMHYPSYGELITKDITAQTKIGQRNRLSFNDIKLANIMYKCPGMYVKYLLSLCFKKIVILL